MDNALHITFIWLHIIGIALWLGPQVFMAFAWVPASRGITDGPTRLRAMRTVTSRFAWIGGAGLVTIVVAGTYLISVWRDYYAVPEEIGFTELRFGVIFIAKMSVFVLLLLVTALHTFKLGPQLIDAYERQGSQTEPVTDAEMRSIRMRSMFASIATLLLTIVIVFLGAMLGSPEYSLQDA